MKGELLGYLPIEEHVLARNPNENFFPDFVIHTRGVPCAIRAATLIDDQKTFPTEWAHKTKELALELMEDHRYIHTRERNITIDLDTQLMRQRYDSDHDLYITDIIDPKASDIKYTLSETPGTKHNT